MMNYRAKDIAEILGVSTATVSLVLNNKSGVSELTRQQVMGKIKELGCEYLLKDFSINNGNIGFVIYKTYGDIVDESPFFMYILEGINQKITEAGYNLKFIYLNDEMSEQEQINLYQIMECRGYIVFGTEMKARDIELLKRQNTPFVVLDNTFLEDNVDCVSIDNAQGISQAMNHLYKMGHRKIGYLRCKYRINSFVEREYMYKQCLDALGLQKTEENILTMGYSPLEIRAAINGFINQVKEWPTAFVAENDFIACNAVQAFQEKGYEVPKDISISGFDDRPICEMITPTLTTICVPKKEFAEYGVNLLLNRMKKKNGTSVKVLIGTKLLVRGSVRRIEEG